MPAFWGKIAHQGAEECWPWLGCLYTSGYGKFRNGYAHRFALADSGVEVEGKFVCHSCDNPACCNPAHLFTGTQRDNMQDMTRKARQSRGSKRPLAKLTEADVRNIRFNTDGISQTELGKRYGVDSSRVSKIKSNKIWRHVISEE
jgi:hypothetical protein